MSTRTLVKSAPQSSNFKVWDEPTSLAQVNDYIRQPFAPVMQVIDKDTLCDGRVHLLVKPVSASCTEEWVVEPEPIVEQQPTSAPSEIIETSQPAELASDLVVAQLQLDWEAIAEYESGCTYGKHDAASRMPPICKDANCPYSQGYLDGYSNFLASSQPPAQKPKPIEWSVVRDPLWDLYQVWVGDRCLQQKAISYEEGERMAQRYVAAEELIRQQNAAVLAGYVK